MSDAVNLLMHAHYGPDEAPRPPARCGDEPWDANPAAGASNGASASGYGPYGGAGAVWDIVRREDVVRLRKWLAANCHRFMHMGKPLTSRPGPDGAAGYDGGDVIFDQVGCSCMKGLDAWTALHVLLLALATFLNKPLIDSSRLQFGGAGNGDANPTRVGCHLEHVG